MFDGATAFNQPLDSWSTDNVVSMDGMFNEATAFNQPLNSWSTGNVEDMIGMFYYSPMNQDLSSWCVGKISDEPDDFGNNNGTNPVWGSCPSAPSDAPSAAPSDAPSSNPTSSSSEGLVIGPSIGAGALVIFTALAWFP